MDGPSPALRTGKRHANEEARRAAAGPPQLPLGAAGAAGAAGAGGTAPDASQAPAVAPYLAIRSQGVRVVRGGELRDEERWPPA